jgi:transcriptional antiterminator RfaH
MHWYVIRTKPFQESRVEFQLRHLSVETFLPLLKQKRIVRRQQKTVVEPLFPRYLFARFKIGEHYRAVNFARGVMKVVEFGAKPAEVNESLIDGIKSRMHGGYVTPKADYFHRGQIVHIKGGPLAGLEAVFVREMKEQDRVMLLLKALGFNATVTVNADQVSLPQAL